jgi:hypothetical protein
LPILGILLAAAQFAAATDDYLKLIPDSAWGFVAVNRFADVNEKAQSIFEEMQLPKSNWLELFKRDSGIQEGMDEKGTIVFLVLASENGTPVPTIVILIPVSDYAKYLASLNPKSETEEVTEVNFFKKNSLSRRLGNYAALAELTSRNTLESLKVADEVSPVMKPWSDWNATQDAAGVIFQPGIKEASSKAQMWINMMKMVLGQAGEQGKKAAAAFGMYEKLCQKIEKEVSSAGVGLQLDGEKTLRITKRALLNADGGWANAMTQVPTAKGDLLKGLPADPIVAAGGIAVSDALIDQMMKSSFELMKSMPDFYGLSDDQIAKISDLAKAKFKGIRSVSMSMGVGESGDPIYANMLAIARVENAIAFIESYEKYFEQYNDAIRGSNSPVMQPVEAERIEIAGKSALQCKMKMPEPPAGQKPPNYEKLMENLIGPGDNFVFWLAPADEHTVVIGQVNKKLLEQAIASIRENKPGLESDASVKKTAAMLPADAPAVIYVSPQGTVEFFKRMMPAVMPPNVPLNFNIPDFPQTSPLGISMKAAPNEVQATLVVPTDVLKGIGQYIRYIKGMSNGAVTVNP